MSKSRISKKIILWTVAIFCCIIIAAAAFIFLNLNRLLTNALNNGFNANRISDVYELKFEDLDVNILTGSVRVFNVKMHPRETPLQQYAYINSTFR